MTMTPIKPNEDNSIYFEWLHTLEKQPEKPVSPRVKEIKDEHKKMKDPDTCDMKQDFERITGEYDQLFKDLANS